MKAYFSWDDNKLGSSNEEETNIYLMADHEENEVTYYFYYHDLFHICKNLNKEISNLKQHVSISKETIYYLEFF